MVRSERAARTATAHVSSRWRARLRRRHDRCSRAAPLPPSPSRWRRGLRARRWRTAPTAHRRRCATTLPSRRRARPRGIPAPLAEGRPSRCRAADPQRQRIVETVFGIHGGEVQQERFAPGAERRQRRPPSRPVQRGIVQAHDDGRQGRGILHVGERVERRVPDVVVRIIECAATIARVVRGLEQPAWPEGGATPSRAATTTGYRAAVPRTARGDSASTTRAPRRSAPDRDP